MTEMPDEIKKRKIYAPAWKFLEAINLENGPHLFAAKSIVNRELLARETEAFKKTLQKDLAAYPAHLEKALRHVSAIESMNVKHPLFFRSAHVDEVELITRIEEIFTVVPEELKISAGQYERNSCSKIP